jgi:hypothetical protein
MFDCAQELWNSAMFLFQIGWKVWKGAFQPLWNTVVSLFQTWWNRSMCLFQWLELLGGTLELRDKAYTTAATTIPVIQIIGTPIVDCSISAGTLSLLCSNLFRMFHDAWNKAGTTIVYCSKPAGTLDDSHSNRTGTLDDTCSSYLEHLMIFAPATWNGSEAYWAWLPFSGVLRFDVLFPCDLR